MVDRLSLRRAVPEPLKRVASAALNAADPLAVRSYRRHAGSRDAIPPRVLRARVGAPGVQTYVDDGRRVASELERILAGYGRRLDELGAIYDFGCGSGRVLTRLGSADGARLAGSDVDDEAVGWLDANYPGVDARPNGQAPPSPFAARSFDLVYSISVFTHLDEPSQLAWLAELQRVLRPDGLAILTTHGPVLYEAFRSGRRPGMTPAQHAALRARGPLDLEGFVFSPEPRWGAWRHRGIESSYGLSFHAHAYIRERWGELLEIVDIAPASINWRQDAVVARAR